MKEVNENGLKSIREILDRYHINPQLACEKAYAKDVDFALAEGCSPILEIISWDCVMGCTSSWFLDETDLDLVIYFDEEA